MPELAGRFAAEFPRHSREQLFALADDIESYPAFIPWCRSARVVSQAGAERAVDNHFGAGPVDLSFRTRAIAAPPDSLEIASEDGPFRRFHLVWRFLDRAGGGCRVEAEYRLAFRSPMLQALARLAVHEAERRIVARFRDRAAALYGWT
ncbi:type II toxin-antitoxin system RatA family toxin [Magnetospirillum sp. UT-4]|uniref:type II toxin-antitoxin system RatA family toxin n=1 Tax=Magnetospirillum sp. UT-4 TaxID=2681467 RepID=UPI0013846DF5|nr:type II toxin-antitoxin system RatA family toxin [Magnetospirillum sp. UT-4]CAA7624460.1 Oligoketide cyclase/lipid transport protein [Magnetospirillum sp. UT-4]